MAFSLLLCSEKTIMWFRWCVFGGSKYSPQSKRLFPLILGGDFFVNMPGGNANSAVITIIKNHKGHSGIDFGARRVRERLRPQGKP